jgi:hypothetical protein
MDPYHYWNQIPYPPLLDFSQSTSNHGVKFSLGHLKVKNASRNVLGRENMQPDHFLKDVTGVQILQIHPITARLVSIYLHQRVGAR